MIDDDSMTASTFDQAGRRSSGSGSAFEDSASKMGTAAHNAAQNARTTAASGLEGAARKLQRGADGLSRAAQGAGERIDASARYVREHDASEMMDDMNEVIRAHPGKSMIAALTIGVLLGRAFRSE